MTRDHGQNPTAKSGTNSALCNLNQSGRGSMQLRLLLHPSNLPKLGCSREEKVNLLANGNTVPVARAFTEDGTLRALTALY